MYRMYMSALSQVDNVFHRGTKAWFGMVLVYDYRWVDGSPVQNTSFLPVKDDPGKCVAVVRGDPPATSELSFLVENCDDRLASICDTEATLLPGMHCIQFNSLFLQVHTSLGCTVTTYWSRLHRHVTPALKGRVTVIISIPCISKRLYRRLNVPLCTVSLSSFFSCPDIATQE